jgi:uncharacterized membrane-anchored protein
MNSPNRRGIIAALACVLIIALINLSIAGKERLLAEGRVVYLQLAPVDPRSLLQGDYMALDFEVARAAVRALPASVGERNSFPDLDADDDHIVVRLDDRSVATFARIADEQALAENEIVMRYRVRNGQLKFATNAFFFREGTGEQYQGARYGMFRVDPHGELLLTSLCDENLQVLGAAGS